MGPEAVLVSAHDQTTDAEDAEFMRQAIRLATEHMRAGHGGPFVPSWSEGGKLSARGGIRSRRPTIRRPMPRLWQSAGLPPGCVLPSARLHSLQQFRALPDVSGSGVLRRAWTGSCLPAPMRMRRPSGSTIRNCIPNCRCRPRRAGSRCSRCCEKTSCLYSRNGKRWRTNPLLRELTVWLGY